MFSFLPLVVVLVGQTVGSISSALAYDCSLDSVVSRNVMQLDLILMTSSAKCFRCINFVLVIPGY